MTAKDDAQRVPRAAEAAEALRALATCARRRSNPARTRHRAKPRRANPRSADPRSANPRSANQPAQRQPATWQASARASPKAPQGKHMLGILLAYAHN